MRLLLLIIVPLHIVLAQGIVVDHRCTDISKIPPAWIAKAKTDLRIGYSHTSHGSQVVTGMEAMKAIPGLDYTYSNPGPQPGVFLNDHWAGYQMDLGYYGGPFAWFDSTISKLEANGNDRNVVVWAWCSGVDANIPGWMNRYLDSMDLLERRYPSVKFVYMTDRVDGDGPGSGNHLGNEQIRAYCTANNKILFDFEDIESYDPDGLVDYVPLKGNENCDYDADNDNIRERNWASEWIAAHPTHELTLLAGACGTCAHTQTLNCIIKARAFWWMMARLAGWDGVVTDVHGSDHPGEHASRGLALVQNYPNPFNPSTTLRYSLSRRERVIIALYSVQGVLVSTLFSGDRDPGEYELKISSEGLASGVYFCSVQAGPYTETRKILLVR